MSAWRRQLAAAARPESTTILAARGIGRGILQGKSWRRVARGFYVPRSAGKVIELSVKEPGRQVERLSTAQRILDATPLLTDDAALGTWAAAYVLGVDWLDGRDPHTMEDLALDIVAPTLKRRSTKAVNYHCSGLPPSDTRIEDGVRVTSLLRTAFDGARWADSLEEAVVFVDSVVALSPLALPNFTAYVVRHGSWVGVNQALQAADAARQGVRSGWETRLRICWTLDAGLPEPLVNAPIFDRTGQLLGIADLFDPGSGFVAEFDGDQHRKTSQHRKDNIREEKFESANLVVVRADKTDVRSARLQLVARLRDGYQRGRLRDRRRDRWTLAQPEWWLEQETPDVDDAEMFEFLRSVDP